MTGTLSLARAVFVILVVSGAFALTQAKADDKFQPPFGGPSKAADSPEAQDYARLQPLYEKLRIAIAIAGAIRDCGTKEQKDAAAKAVSEAFSAFADAAAAYMSDYGPHPFTKDDAAAALHMKSNVKASGQVWHDVRALLAEMKRRSKAITVPNPCPGQQPIAIAGRGTGCADKDTPAKIETARADLARIEKRLEVLEGVMASDRAKYDKAVADGDLDRVKTYGDAVKKDQGQWIDLYGQASQLEIQISELEALDPCPATTETPPAGGGEGAKPPCADPQVQADLDAAEAALRKNQEDRLRVSGVITEDRNHVADMETKFGADSDKAKAAKKVLDDDETKQHALEVQQAELEDKIGELKKKLAAPCPGGATPPPNKSDRAGLPPCDDGDNVAKAIEDDEGKLATVTEQERSASGEALADLKVEEASLRDELEGLNGLKACPSDYHPPKDEGSGPSITIGIGVGVGGDDHRHHGDDHPHDDHHD